MKKRLAFTLSELLIVLLIIAVILMITIPLMKRRLNKVDKIAYYMGYKVAWEIGKEVVAQMNMNENKNFDFCANVFSTLNNSSHNCTTFDFNDGSDFASATPNIVLDNGLKIYIADNSSRKVDELSVEESAYIPSKTSLIAKINNKIFAIWNNILAFFKPDQYYMTYAADSVDLEEENPVDDSIDPNVSNAELYYSGPSAWKSEGCATYIEANAIMNLTHSAYVDAACCSSCKEGYNSKLAGYMLISKFPVKNSSSHEVTYKAYSTSLYVLYNNLQMYWSEMSGDSYERNSTNTGQYSCRLCEKSQSCTISSCGNGILKYPKSINCYCECNAGYKQNASGVCVKEESACEITAGECGANAYLDSVSCSCKCNAGYKQNASGVCEEEVIPDGGSSGSSGSTGTQANGYTIYIDVNGDKGNTVYGEDVFKFYLLTTGQVVPVGRIANSEASLAFDIIYDDFSGTVGQPGKVLRSNLSFKDAACIAGYVNEASAYCTGKNKSGTCTDDAACRIRVKRPYKGLRG